ncbi:MAG: UDP-N-acetylmuramoyl-L-alanyl-D-glutamate--2,6-diaminopimelate ligase [bacterium]
MKLDLIVRALTGVVAIKGSLGIEISGIAYDSRHVRRGGLFVAMPGTHADGWAYVDEAVERGAAAILSSHPGCPKHDITCIQVRNVRQALAEAAAAMHRFPAARLRVLGVTGTNGKTTTAYLLRRILADAGWAPGLIGTVQYEFGERVIPAHRTTPESADLHALFDQMLQAGCRSVVMEVSSHALDQGRVRGVDFDAALFTNLTRDHLDYHDTMDAYFETKCRLFTELGRNARQAVAVINLDDPYGARLAALPLTASVVTYSISSPVAQVRAVDVVLGPDGSQLTIVTGHGRFPLALHLLGRFNVYNALSAFATATALGIAPEVVLRAIGAVLSVPGRMEPISNCRGLQIFVDYAHTDDALNKALTTLNELRVGHAGRMIVVFGCGGNRDIIKRGLMGAVARQLADHVVLTSDNPRKEDPLAILAAIRAGYGEGGSCEIESDRAKAIRRALTLARAGDFVLIAGKGHETTQEFANTIVPFDDREETRRALQESG